MHEYCTEWFEPAEEDSDAAQILFRSRKYRQAAFSLQQTCEKISKGLMMRIGFLPTHEEDEETKEMRTIVGVHPSTLSKESALPRVCRKWKKGGC